MLHKKYGAGNYQEKLLAIASRVYLGEDPEKYTTFFKREKQALQEKCTCKAGGLYYCLSMNLMRHNYVEISLIC